MAREPVAAETLSHLIGAIYDCAVDPGRWPGTLTALREALGFAQGVMNVIDIPSGDLLLNVPSGIAPARLATMPLYAADVVEQWGGPETFRTVPLDEPLILSQVRPKAEREGNRFHREWAGPQGIIDTMVLALARSPDAVGSIGLARHVDAGPIGDEAVTAGRLLLPHLQRAVAISRVIDLKTVAAATCARALDALSAAVVLVGPGPRDRPRQRRRRGGAGPRRPDPGGARRALCPFARRRGGTGGGGPAGRGGRGRDRPARLRHPGAARRPLAVRPPRPPHAAGRDPSRPPAGRPPPLYSSRRLRRLFPPRPRRSPPCST
jgi:hypothetical protein